MGDNEIRVHFISEIKTKGYYVIDVKVFLPSLMRFLPKKGANSGGFTTKYFFR